MRRFWCDKFHCFLILFASPDRKSRLKSTCAATPFLALFHTFGHVLGERLELSDPQLRLLLVDLVVLRLATSLRAYSSLRVLREITNAFAVDAFGRSRLLQSSRRGGATLVRYTHRRLHFQMNEEILMLWLECSVSGLSFIDGAIVPSVGPHSHLHLLHRHKNLLLRQNHTFEAR